MPAPRLSRSPLAESWAASEGMVKKMVLEHGHGRRGMRTRQSVKLLLGSVHRKGMYTPLMTKTLVGCFLTAIALSGQSNPGSIAGTVFDPFGVPAARAA